jgi:phosphoglycolate phosphatase
MMRYKLVIFDLDGTLIDSSKGILHAAKETLTAIDLPQIPDKEIINCIGPPLAQSMTDHGLIPSDRTSDFNKKFRSLYKNKYLAEANLYPGVLEMLSSLKSKTRIAIATNKREDYAITLLNEIGLTRYCDVVKGSDMDGSLKKKDLIEYCIQTAEIDARSDVVMVGDTFSDYDGAFECGINFIGVSFGYGFKKGSEQKSALY